MSFERSARRHWSATLVIGLILLPPVEGRAAIEKGESTIDLEPVAEGLVSPVFATHAGDGSGRLFVVDQSGQIRIVSDGTLLPQPLLDLTDRMVVLNGGFDERGLLGLAFHPDYETNGRFFVRYSAPRNGDPDEPCADPDAFVPGCHAEVLSEFSVSDDPNVADPDSEIVLLRVDEPQFNHNAGQIAFGPDGYLYVSLGDGGGANDGLADQPPSHGPIGNGQNPETLLGALLRLDVDSDPPYAIPPDNPFVGRDGRDEVFAYGFRNPYRFAFDDGPGGNGALYVADVGQALVEEIDVVTAGGNYGWAVKEGTLCFDPMSPGNPPDACDDVGLIDPLAEYTHEDGGLAIVGGFVYRGSEIQTLRGRYVFGDYSADFGPTGRLYYLQHNGSDYEIREVRLGENDVPLGAFLKGFGQDEDGELYALVSDEGGPTGTTGALLRITELRNDGDGDGSNGAGSGSTGGPRSGLFCGAGLAPGLTLSLLGMIFMRFNLSDRWGRRTRE